jgi:hypothetical protein
MVEPKEPTWCLLSEVVGRVLSSLPAPAQAQGQCQHEDRQVKAGKG